MNEKVTAADLDLLKIQIASLDQLLEVQEQVVYEQSQRLNGVVRDLQLERGALLQSEERIRSIIEAALDAVVSLDAGGMVIDWNEQAEKILGWSRQEASGHSLDNFMVPAESCSFVEIAQGPLSQRRLECTATHRDGHVFPVELSISRVDSGTRTILSVFFRDITQRKQDEEVLLKSEERFHLVARATRDTVWDWDFGTNQLWWNDNFETTFRYAAEEIVPDANKWIELLHPDDSQRVMDSIYNVVDGGGQIWSGEYRFRRGDGSYALVNNRAYVVRDRTGKAVRMIGSFMDISEREQIKEELIRSKELAESATLAKSEFLARMSHEIRTPLNGVLGMTGLLLDTELSPQQREYAETASSSGETLLMLVNDILDYSKIEAGKMSLEHVALDLCTLIEDVSSLLAERAHLKNVELVVSVDEQLHMGLQGDLYRLKQVLTNLASNAIKFTAAGEVVIRAKLVAETGSAAIVRFEVSDTGIGIAPAQQERLFQAFSQADHSTTRKYGGTGLGLAICTQLVMLMDGQIGVKSETGQGSLFWFTAKLAKQSQSAPTILPSRTNLRGLRVLVVDDNATNRSVLHERIIAWGMRNGSAENGPRALELLRTAAVRSEPYEAVILDMQMPGMDGLSVARAIKADSRIASAVLILLIDMGQSRLVDESRDAGVAACLLKPTRASALYNCLMEVMGRQPASKAGLPAAAAKRPNAVDRSHIRILVAEDNLVNQLVARGILQAHGYRPDIVANGVEAVEAVARTAYAVVLMDCQMPEMDGYEAAAEIRIREGAERHTPIIAMTAHSLQGEREKCLAAGMDDYLAKPVRPAELYAALERWSVTTASAEALAD